MKWLKAMEKKAGTWALPYTKTSAEKLSTLVTMLDKGDIFDIEIDDQEFLMDRLYHVYGDDDLYDKIDIELGKINTKAIATIIRSKVKEMLKQYKDTPRDFDSKFDPEAIKILSAL